MPCFDRRTTALGPLLTVALTALTSCRRSDGALDPRLGSARFALTVPGVQATAQ